MKGHLPLSVSNLLKFLAIYHEYQLGDLQNENYGFLWNDLTVPGVLNCHDICTLRYPSRVTCHLKEHEQMTLWEAHSDKCSF